MTRTRTFTTIGAGLLAAGIAVAALGGGASAATQNVSVGNNLFSDATSSTSTTTIVAGDTVLWTWAAGSSLHSVTADDNSFDSNPPSGFQSSGTFSQIFNTPGTYEYYCRVHSTVSPANFMNGTIIVQAVPTATNTGAAATSTPAPATSTPVPGTATHTRTPAPTTTGTPQATGTPLATVVGATPTVPAAGAGPSVQAPVAGAGMEAGDGSGLRWISLALAAVGAIAIGVAAVSHRRA